MINFQFYDAVKCPFSKHMIVQHISFKKSENTEPKGSDVNTPTERRFKPSKLGISALQIFRFDCGDTLLGRGLCPFDPEKRKSTEISIYELSIYACNIGGMRWTLSLVKSK